MFGAFLLAALAVSPSPSPSATPPPEIARVVTADRSEGTLKNSARTTFVVTAADIARNGYQTVADAIATLPGVEVSHYGAVGEQATIGIRGSASSEVLVLVNGVPAPGSFSNSVELANLPTAGVARIEVVEGGGSTLYGTGAIGGIINVITATQHAPYSALVRDGSFGDQEAHVSAAGFTIDRVVAANNYALPAPATGARVNSDYQSSALHYGYQHNAGALDLAFHADLESDSAGAPGGDTFLSTSSRERDVNNDVDFSLSRRGAQSLATLQLGASRQQILFGCNPDGSDPNCFQTTDALTTETRTTLSLRNSVNGASERFAYGIDVSRGNARGDDGNGDIVTNAIAQSAAYMQETWVLRNDNRVYTGLRGERDGALGGEFSPSAGFIARLGGDTDLKVNAATAFRAPNATELYFPFYGNPALHPERAQVGDITLENTHVLGGASFGWFTNRTNDLIEYDPATFAPENIDHAFLQGFTLDLRTKPLHGVYTALNVTDLYRAEDLDAQARLARDPAITANLRLGILGNRLGVFDEAAVTARVVGARGTVDTTLPLFDQPAGYTDLGAYISLRLSTRALLTLRGDNLGNERYAEINGYPMPGRSFAVEVRTK